MPLHQETREVPYTAQQMFNLVADIEKYPDFIPWCQALRVRSDKRVEGVGEVTADMVVRYKLFLEQFRSLVFVDPRNNLISADYLQGPIKKLHNRWKFQDMPDGGSQIDFYIDFEFRNRLLQRIAEEVFDRAFAKMSDAFINRAHAIYPAPDQ